METTCGWNTGSFVKEINLTDVTWTSNDTNIATVDRNGNVTGVAEGNTTIIAQYNGRTLMYEINVNPPSFPILIVALIVVTLISMLTIYIKRKNKN